MCHGKHSCSLVQSLGLSQYLSDTLVSSSIAVSSGTFMVETVTLGSLEAPSLSLPLKAK